MTNSNTNTNKRTLWTIGPGRALRFKGETVAYMARAASDGPPALAPAEMDAFAHTVVAALNAAQAGSPVTEPAGGKIVAYLRHGRGAGPFGMESVPVKHLGADRYQVMFEGRWRKVHVQVHRLYIVYQGETIDVQIDGV